jgi:hypothetical protein
VISNKSRKFWIGASDVKFVMGNWNTATFVNWWQTKLGVKENSFKNIYTIAGTNIEHRIAEHYSKTHNVKVVLDRQVKIKKYRLRVNLDCETKDKIIEIKTHKHTDGEWKIPSDYWCQVQVQMFATGKRSSCIYAYALKEEDYENFFLPIDNNRIGQFDIEYDEQWVHNEYLPRLVYLAECLKKRKTPNMREFKEKTAKWE